MNTKAKNATKKTQRKETGHRREMKSQKRNTQAIHIYLGAHEQEHPETRMTR